MKAMKYWMTVAGAAALLVSAQASATVINFEDAGSHGLADNDQVTNEYSGAGVTFTGAYLEHTGGGDDNPQGFLNDATGNWDDPFASATPSLGDWFLRSDGEVDSRGGTGVYLSVFYANPVNGASGQIWDIDGNASQGTEQWSVMAYNGTTLVGSDLSPVGTSPGSGSLNGLPWNFQLDGITFDRIDFVFTGTKDRGIGLAFDNFNTSSATTVPEPAALGMFGLGALLIGLFAGLRRRMG